MVYDAFTGAADALRSHYMQLRNNAATPEEKAEWWAEVLRVRDAEDAVEGDDRDALIEHITTWRSQLNALRAGNGG